MDKQSLRYWSLVLRQDIVTMLATSGSGHSAGALGMADIFAVLYFQILRHNPKQPNWSGRDRLVLSAGHICPVLYAALAETGYFPRKLLLTLRAFESPLQGHPHYGELPGIENSSGPLGQGLSEAIGMTLSARMDQAGSRVYAVLSDGEHQEGQTWEAIQMAGALGLDNLVAIVDRNRIQISGPTETVLPLDSLAEKYRSFRWRVIEVDGHNINQLLDAFGQVGQSTGQPVCILADTIPGKGVDFMEGQYQWHGRSPNKKEAELALLQLQQGYQEGV